MNNTITTSLFYLVKDISDNVTPIEFCQLISGNPSEETLNKVRHLISTKYPKLKNFNSSQKLTNLFSIIGTSIDPRVCESVLRNLDKAEPSFRTASKNLDRFNTRARNTLSGRVNKGDMQEFFSRHAKSQSKKAEELFRIANATARGGNPMADLIPDPLASPDNLDGVMPRNPVSYDFLVDAVATSILDPIESMFNKEVKEHVPSLFQVRDDSGAYVFANDFSTYLRDSLLKRSTETRSRLSVLDNFYASGRDWRKFMNLTIPSRQKVRDRPYDASFDPLKKFIPFVTELASFSGDLTEELKIVYGLPFRTPAQDLSWDDIKSPYTIKIVDRTNNEVVFGIRNQSPLSEDKISFLNSLGRPSDYAAPAAAGAFHDILRQAWGFGENYADYQNFFRPHHYSNLFPKISSIMLKHVASKILGHPSMLLGDSHPLFEKRLLKKLSELVLSSDSTCKPPEQGILDLTSIQEEIVRLERESLEKDRTKRSIKALCGPLYQLYLRVIAIKIVLEAMFVFSKFDSKDIFSSKLFLKYYLKYFIRSVKQIDKKFLSRMIGFFRNHITETREHLEQDSKFIDPLTGEQVKVITRYYVSSAEEQPGASRGTVGDHEAIPAHRIMQGPLPTDSLESLIDVFQSEDIMNPCEQEPPEVGLGLFGGDRVEPESGLKIIGFFEYFVKKQLAELIKSIDSVFKERAPEDPKQAGPYPRIRADFSLLGAFEEINVAKDTRASNFGPSTRFFDVWPPDLSNPSDPDSAQGRWPAYRDGGFVLERYVRVEDFDQQSAQGLKIVEEGDWEFIFDRPEELNGVVSIDSWANYLKDLLQIRGDRNVLRNLIENNGRKLNLFYYFKDVKFGYRLSFVYPLRQNEDADYPLVTVNRDAEFARNLMRQQWQQDIPRHRIDSEKAYILKETTGVGEDQNILTIFLVPVVKKEVSIRPEDLERYRGAELFVDNFQNLYRNSYKPILRKQMHGDLAYKTIFEYVFPLERFLSLLTIYNAEFIRGMSGREDFLKETQKMIINSCEITEGVAKPDWWKTPVSVKEEQLGVSKKQLGIFAILKIIQGLINMIPPLKPWFKIPGMDMGLFEAIPTLFSKVLNVGVIKTPLDAALALPGLGLIRRMLGAILDLIMPKSKKLPPTPGTSRDILADEEEEEEC